MKRSGTVFTVVSVLLFQSKTSLTNDEKPKDCVEMKIEACCKKVGKMTDKVVGRQERQTESKG